ncbi:MAG: type II secretion system F family protein [Candidatus ainarchaeum sp.]|nr:type II secretion system F family protein [Candidatus ainarchaeum sp.]
MKLFLRRIAIISSLLIPEKIIDTKIKQWLIYAGSKNDERIWIGTRIFLSIMMGIIGFLIPFSVIPLLNIAFGLEIYFEPLVQIALMIILGLIGFLLTILLFYLHISYAIDGRKKMVEAILPDFLFLVGNNLKSGMTPFYAFRSAVRPEFGPLSEEIQIATQKSLGIDSFADSLKTIANRIDSQVLVDTTKFFSNALKSGGRLAQLIETSANDIKQTNALKKELISATRMYTMFIIFVVIIASPMLLAVSVQFLNILSGIQLQTAGVSTSGSGMGAAGLAGGGLKITPDFMKMMGYIIIIGNSFLASIFIGVLSGGKIRDGLKLAPVLAIIGAILFMIMLQGIGALVGNF